MYNRLQALESVNCPPEQGTTAADTPSQAVNAWRGRQASNQLSIRLLLHVTKVTRLHDRRRRRNCDEAALRNERAAGWGGMSW